MDNKEAVKRLLLLLGRYKKTIVVIVGCLLVSTGLNLCVPLISRDRKSTRLNSSHPPESRMPSSA